MIIASNQPQIDLPTLEENANVLRQHLDTIVSIELADVVSLQKHIVALTSLLGTADELVTEAQKHYNIVESDAILRVRNCGLTASLHRVWIKSKVAEEQRILDYLSDIRKDMRTKIEACRSLLTFLRSERELTHAIGKQGLLT